MLAVLLGLVFFATDKTAEDIVQMLSQQSTVMDSKKELLRPIQEKTRLDAMYNKCVETINNIERSEISPAEKSSAVRAYRKSSRNADDTNYLVTTCEAAFSSKPTDWETLRRCFFIGEAGFSQGRLISIATSVVSFEGVETEDVSPTQIAVTLRAMTMLARVDWPGRLSLLQKCADGSLWLNRDIRCKERPDLRRLLQNHAILSLAALPIPDAEKIVTGLEQQYPSSRFSEKSAESPLALSVAIVKADLERQKQGLPALMEDIR